MFNFFKEKIKKAFDKLKSADEDIEEEKKKASKAQKQGKKEVKKLERKEKQLKKSEKKRSKQLKEVVAKEERTESVKELVRLEQREEDLKEDIQEIQQEEEKVEEKKEEKAGFLSLLKSKFLSSRLTRENFEELFEPIELALIENNFSMKIIEKLKERLGKALIDQSFTSKELQVKAKEVFKEVIKNSMLEPFDLVEKIREKKDKPYTVVFFGINGAGKTTTIAKVVHMLKKNNIGSVLAAADTFRAASIEQLEKHADKLEVKVIKHDYGADPAAVAFDAIAHAKAKGIDAVLIDTAGRMHTKADLMKEMEKICRVAKPDLKIFIGEAITGSDLLEQLSKFNESIGIDAAILTKADVDEKGGAMISVGEVTGKPVIYIGVGQEYKDLQPFNKDKILESLFSSI